MTGFEVFEKIDTEVASLAAHYEKCQKENDTPFIQGYLEALDDIGNLLSRIHNDPNLRTPEKESGEHE